ncbi:unnamed protein product [Danaus chrysippus]|uniref:(African queen) hypothetical protein n=1 Tax=Danaus chrysippus TaxID=151541 RepID=A0A8J2VQU7_9NEOP|nr:unnamed protein product [Danaus chrysippus]
MVAKDHQPLATALPRTKWDGIPYDFEAQTIKASKHSVRLPPACHSVTVVRRDVAQGSLRGSQHCGGTPEPIHIANWKL